MKVMPKATHHSVPNDGDRLPESAGATLGGIGEPCGFSAVLPSAHVFLAHQECADAISRHSHDHDCSIYRDRVPHQGPAIGGCKFRSLCRARPAAAWLRENIGRAGVDSIDLVTRRADYDGLVAESDRRSKDVASSAIRCAQYKTLGRVFPAAFRFNETVGQSS